MLYSKEYLKERYDRLPQYVEIADQHIRKITSSAYSHIRLISNQALTRNPHSGQFFKNLLFEEPPRSINWALIVAKLLRYYAVSLAHFAVYLLTFLLEKVLFEPPERHRPRADEPLYLIDTFLLVDKVLEERKFTDYYFGALYSILCKQQKTYLLLPRIYGRLTPFTIRKVMQTLEKSEHPFITEFQLLKPIDLVRAFWFILIYPIDVLRLAARLPREEAVDRLFSAELLHTIDQVNNHNFIRYWFGKRVGELYANKLNLISWNENQTIDKNLFKGLRETAPSITIYGCQFYIGYPPFMNERIVGEEKPFGVTPDCVLVNGPAYTRAESPVECRVGVSLRYPGVFAQSIDWLKKRNTILCLSLFQELNNELIRLASDVPGLQNQPMAVRPHPADSKRRLPRLPELWKYTLRNRYDLIAESSILLTSESSVAVEAAALGTSVVIIASQKSFTCNPMLPLGRGEIWDIAFDSTEIEETHVRLLEFRSRHPNRLRELAEAYKAQCFVEPTEGRIASVFHLNQA